ncbi:hypothetical protein SAMN05216436_12290 [bacterium A37T11]|nr:hypothetical protein SAMN05216436_12290 [bacterium A37T11]
MSPDVNHPILQQPIHTLPLSAEFKLVAEMLGFHTLTDLLQKRTAELKKMPGFTQNLVIEYVYFLETNNLGDLVWR